jgi:outer membrane immunogenic protein
MLVGKCVRSCGAALFATMIASPAPAADYYSSSTGNYGGYKDLPAKAPEPSWQGLYLGVSGGWAWSSINAANNVLILTNNGTLPFSSPSASGLLGGGQIGYNVQAGNFVYGIEADFDALDDTASGSVTDPHNSARVLSVKSSTGLYSDITGRAGLLMGNALLYAKGGLALFTGNVHVSDHADGISQDSGTFLGWTLGGGAEYRLTPNISVKAEYQYFDVDNTNFSCCLPASSKLEDKITANTLKIGVNYLVDWKHSPLD